MDSGRARELFERFAGAMAYVAIERPDGSQGIGSAFHVGEGVFVTARHVVEGFRIREIGTTERAYIDLHGEEAKNCKAFVRENGQERPVHMISAAKLELDAGPFYSPEGVSVDVASFRVKGFDPRLPWVPLGDHLDDWLGQSDFVLSEAIVLGYPPIPLTSEPHLVAARAEVNAQVDLREIPHVHFILSATPRGGFSGGLVFSELGFALGVVTSSLLSDGQPSELGFFGVISVQPIYSCLAFHKILPDCQATSWDDFWNSESEYFYKRNRDVGHGRQVAATVTVFDDGKRFYLELHCEDLSLLAQIEDRSTQSLSPLLVSRQEVRPGVVKLQISQNTEDARFRLDLARQAATEVLSQANYVPIFLRGDPANS